MRPEGPSAQSRSAALSVSELETIPLERLAAALLRLPGWAEAGRRALVALFMVVPVFPMAGRELPSAGRLDPLRADKHLAGPFGSPAAGVPDMSAAVPIPISG